MRNRQTFQWHVFNQQGVIWNTFQNLSTFHPNFSEKSFYNSHGYDYYLPEEVFILFLVAANFSSTHCKNTHNDYVLLAQCTCALKSTVILFLWQRANTSVGNFHMLCHLAHKMWDVTLRLRKQASVVKGWCFWSCGIDSETHQTLFLSLFLLLLQHSHCNICIPKLFHLMPCGGYQV